jgi:hypothetical protein
MEQPQFWFNCGSARGRPPAEPTPPTKDVERRHRDGSWPRPSISTESRHRASEAGDHQLDAPSLGRTFASYRLLMDRNNHEDASRYAVTESRPSCHV